MGLEGMVAKQDLWVEINVQNIPDELVDLLASQMRSGFEQAMEAQSGDMSEEELEASRQSGEQLMKNLEEAIAGTEKFAVGLGIRPQDKSVTIDYGTKFVDGSRYAKQMNQFTTAKSALAGSLSEANMMTLKAFQLVSEEDLAQIETTLDTSLRAAYKSIEENAKDEASAKRAREYLDRLIAILVESCKKGSMETVATVSTNPSLNILAAFSVADGSQVEALAKDLAAEIANEGAPVKIELKSGTYKGVTLHRLTAPLPENAEDAARKIFGDEVNVSIGTAPKAVYLSVGKTAEASLKAALDGVAATPSMKADPIQMRFDVAQLLSFIQSIEANPIVDGMLSSMGSGDDRVMIDSQLIDRGALARITVQEGVLKAIAGGVKAGMAAQQGGF
jgi:hypothetical protein